MGGGAASSRVHRTTTNATATAAAAAATEEHHLLDLDAVQRGDAEMGNRVNRLLRACIELLGEDGEGNPIVSIHDQVK